MPNDQCPDCDADVHVEANAEKGDIVDCDECGLELEVVGLDPVKFEVVEDEPFDDDDDEDEF